MSLIWEYIKHNVASEKHISHKPFDTNSDNYEISHEIGERECILKIHSLPFYFHKLFYKFYYIYS